MVVYNAIKKQQRVQRFKHNLDRKLYCNQNSSNLIFKNNVYLNKIKELSIYLKNNYTY